VGVEDPGGVRIGDVHEVLAVRVGVGAPFVDGVAVFLQELEELPELLAGQRSAALQLLDE
jgi:hypothetical protein